MVGDHCTDDTEYQIAKLRDDRITFVNLPERGPYPPAGQDRWRVAGTYAANEAIRLSQGAFLTHLDDDDIFVPDRLEVLVQAAQQDRADFLWHPFWSEATETRKPEGRQREVVDRAGGRCPLPCPAPSERSASC